MFTPSLELLQKIMSGRHIRDVLRDFAKMADSAELNLSSKVHGYIFIGLAENGPIILTDKEQEEIHGILAATLLIMKENKVSNEAKVQTCSLNRKTGEIEVDKPEEKQNGK